MTAATALRTARAAWSKLMTAYETRGAGGVEACLDLTGFELAPVLVAVGRSGDAKKLGEVLCAFDTISGTWTRNEAGHALLRSRSAFSGACLDVMANYTGKVWS